MPMLEQSTRIVDFAARPFPNTPLGPTQTSLTSSPVATIVNRTSTPAKSASSLTMFAPRLPRGSAFDLVRFHIDSE